MTAMHPNAFKTAARRAIRDLQLQAAVAITALRNDTKRQAAMTAVSVAHGETLRDLAAEAKRRALRQFPELLVQAEAALQANGMQVLWAQDAEEARRQVLEIARRHGARRVVKSKSMLTEELALNEALIHAGLTVVETDLGEYIVQLAHEPPGHIVGPALHMSKERIRDLLVRELGMPPTDAAEAMTQFVRGHLRQVFLEADLGIVGGNFIIAETGTLCLSTNEGNGRMVSTLPRVLVALVGIEKIVATVEDYATLVQLLARSATGQTLTVYSHLLHGPRRPDEADGPDQVYVVLVDNGRSAIYGTNYAEVLACLRCGACLNACPVFQVAGGHAYGSVYSGPIGAVLTPLLRGLDQATPLPFASSLCGKCKDVCPVRIDLPQLLLDLRRDLVAGGHTPRIWRAGMRGWALSSRSPRRFTWLGRVVRAVLRHTPRRLHGLFGAWTRARDLPPAPSASFRAWWHAHRRPHDQP